MKKKKLLSVFLSVALSLSLFNASLIVSKASGSTTDELKGKPWVTSVLQGNLPAERPDVKDDLYTYYNYDYLAAHQEKPGMALLDHEGEMMESILKVLFDKSKSNHDLDQVRIFFNQAMDTETLKKEGLSRVQPFLDRIEAVTSIEEMNELLTASDFPFSPFLMTTLSVRDTRDVNIVYVYPNLLFMDPIEDGGLFYQDSEDPNEQEMIDSSRFIRSFDSLLDLCAQGMSEKEVSEAYKRMMAFEKQHARYVDYNSNYSDAEYGAYAQSLKEGVYTLDELCALCSNFPIKALLDKLEMGNSEEYAVSEGWPEAFNELWVDENNEVIKEIAVLKILNETRPYRDQTDINNKKYEYYVWPVPDAGTLAFNACDNLDTFAIALADIYAKDGLGTKAKDRLTNLTEDMINTYKDLVKETPWISEGTKARIIEKLDHITVNMLEPADGYYNFSELELVPTEDGGTLFDNYLKLKAYRQDQESRMVGKSATYAAVWHMLKPTNVSAFYNLQTNSIDILTGYINSFKYTDDMSETELLAGAGFVIAHELSHGFDYLGSQLDAYGTPTPLFADEDVDAFERKNSALAEYYDSIEVLPGVMEDGSNDIAEAVADLIGLQIVLETAGKRNIEYEDLFKYFADKWAVVYSEGYMDQQLLTAHPLDNLRINVCSQMFEPMYETYDIKEGESRQC